MKKNALEIGNAVEFKFEGGIDNGILLDKGVYRAEIELATEGEDGSESIQKISVPYKDIVGLMA